MIIHVLNDIKMKLVKLYILVLTIIAVIPVSAQTYTLEQCRTMALRHNVEIQNADIDISKAQEQEREAFTNYFPTVSASGMGMNSNKHFVNMNMGQFGMQMVKDGLMGSVTATQPVFAGGQIVNGHKLSKLGIEVSKLNRRVDANEVVRTAEEYYWNVVELKSKIEVIDAADKMLSSTCADVRNAVDAGITERNELLQIQIRLNDNRSTRANLVNSLKLAKMVLAQYTGITDADYDVAESINPGQLPEFPFNLKVDHKTALPSTAEYQLLQKNVESKQLSQKLERGKYMPTVAVGAGYIYQDLMDHGQGNGIVFATVSVPISGWWGGSHSIRRKKMEVEAAQNTLRDNSELLVINMQSKWNDVENAYEQLKIKQETIAQSEENLRLYRNYFEAGTKNMSDLLDAEMTMQQSKDSYIEAYSDYQQKIVQYKQAIGK